MAEKNAVYHLQSKDVLFEDDVIIVVNKPAGLPSQATPDPNRDHCFAAVQRYLANKSAHPYVGLHHRLDALTSGALLMTKSQAVNASISEQFQQHTIRKSYCAVCIGLEPELPEYVQSGYQWTVNRAIGEIPGGKIQKFGVDGKKRKPARTGIICESAIRLRDGIMGVYRCSPETGRTHQIRVHLASLGLHIVGDSLYGIAMLRSLRAIDPGRMCLHAETLEFVHPVSKEVLCIRAPRPTELSAFVRKASKIPGVISL